MKMNVFELSCRWEKPRKNPQQSSDSNTPCLFCSVGLVLDNVPSTCGHSSTGHPLFGSPAESLYWCFRKLTQSVIITALRLQGRAEPPFGGKANNGRKGNMISNIV